MDEIIQAIKEFEVDKSPGCDGLCISFYRKFFSKSKEPLLMAYRQAYKTGHLHISARRGVLALIPNKSQNLNECRGRRVCIINAFCIISAFLKYIGLFPHFCIITALFRPFLNYFVEFGDFTRFSFYFQV